MKMFAKAQRIEDDSLDSYAKGGVVLSRDSAHRAIAALRRDAHEMRARGGHHNRTAAAENDELAKAIGIAMR